MSDAPTEDHASGVPEGTVLESTQDGQVVREIIVNDLDDNGNVVGWHKQDHRPEGVS